MKRRNFFALAASGGVALAPPKLLRAQPAGEPLRLGLLTAKTDPPASGGIDWERGLRLYSAKHGQQLGGRKVELLVTDTGGVPATARTKTQELLEREKAHVLMGPLAAFEALATDDYMRARKIPVFPVAAAEDMTQRKASPWLFRASSTSGISAWCCSSS